MPTYLTKFSSIGVYNSELGTVEFYGITTFDTELSIVWILKLAFWAFHFATLNETLKRKLEKEAIFEPLIELFMKSRLSMKVWTRGLRKFKQKQKFSQPKSYFTRIQACMLC